MNYLSAILLLKALQGSESLPLSVLERVEMLARRLSEVKGGTSMERALRSAPSVRKDPDTPAFRIITFSDPSRTDTFARVTFDIEKIRFRSFSLSGRSISRRSERTMTPESAMAKVEEVYRLLGGEAQLRIQKASGLYEPQCVDNPDLILVPDVHGPTPIFQDDLVEMYAYQVVNKIPFTSWKAIGCHIDMKTGRVEWMSIPALPDVIPPPSRLLPKLAYRSMAERDVAETLKGLQMIEEKAFQLWYWDDSVDLTAVHNEDYRPEWRNRPARLVYEGTYRDMAGDRGVRIAYDAVTGERLARLEFSKGSGFSAGSRKKPLAPLVFDLEPGPVKVRTREKEINGRGALVPIRPPRKIPQRSTRVTLARGRLRILADFFPEIGLLRCGHSWGQPDKALLNMLGLAASLSLKS